MQLQITIKPLPVRGNDAVDVMVEVREEGYWVLDVAKDFHLTPGENHARAIAFALEEVRRLLTSEVQAHTPPRAAPPAPPLRCQT